MEIELPGEIAPANGLRSPKRVGSILSRKFMVRCLVAIAILVPVLAATFEHRLRERFRQANAGDVDIHRMIIYSHRVERRPHATLSFRLFGLNAELLASADVKQNNLGYIATKDYAIPRAAGEFRIVVLGGEQTASSVSSRSWPDFLEEKLAALDPSRNIRVYNLAWPDAGPAHYIEYWKKEGSAFAPDLVIVNFVETDFNRPMTDNALKFRGKPVVTELPLEIRLGPDDNEVVLTRVAAVAGTTIVTSYRDPSVIPSRPYGLFASRALMDDRRKVRDLQKRIVNEMIDGAIADLGFLTVKAFGGKPIPTVAQIRNFDPPGGRPADRESMVAFGVEHFGWMLEHIPNTLLLHNFHHGELAVDWELSKAMVARNPRLSYIDMRQRVPPGLSDGEIRSWYMIPHMGEKWNLKGHEAYAAMVADVVQEWRQTGRVHKGRIGQPDNR